MRHAPYVHPVRVLVQRRPDGTLILSNPHPLRPAYDSVVAPLLHWASVAPDRIWLAVPDAGEGPVIVTYAQGVARVAALAAGLARRFARGSVIAIGSGNSIAHALVTYAAAWAGLIAAPVTPAYAEKARDPRRLHEALAVTGAAALFLEGAGLERAAGWAAAAGVPVTSMADAPFGTQGEIVFEGLSDDPQAAPDPGGIDPDRPCKLLLTSGSTGAPKAVVVTHRNLACNAAQIRSTFDPDGEAEAWPDGIVMANHLPWSHSLGGNAVLHMLTHAGGTLWIDPGAPNAAGLARTVATLKSVAVDYHITVPLGWALLADALEADEDLARTFFSRLRIMQYGGAALTADVFERLQAVARRQTGDEITLAAGYGATETAPTVCNVHWPNRVMGLVGLPVPGLELKLAPEAGKLEARVRGPGVTPGYWRDPERSAAAFDEEGFYRLGDALRFADPDRPEAGLAFDGRLSERFKLANGSFVPVGMVRARLVEASDGLFSDAVICGEGAQALSALAFVAPARAAALAGADTGDLAALARHPTVRAAALAALRAAADGEPPTRRVARLILLDRAPSLEEGEITDKGYLNQARCRASFADAAARLTAREPGPDILDLDRPDGSVGL